MAVADAEGRVIVRVISTLEDVVVVRAAFFVAGEILRALESRSVRRE